MSNQNDNKFKPPVVTFTNNPVLNEPASQKAGRPIFDDMEVCEIRFPGDTKCWAVFPAHEAEPNATREGGYVITYAEHYNAQYLQFKNQSQQTVAGTPLSEAPFLTEAKRRELRALNIHTVEALAALDGAHLKTLGMGGREWKNQAQAYLDRAGSSADVTGMAAKIALLEERLAIAEATAAGVKRATPAPAAAGDEGGTEKSLEECSDDELRSFITAQGGKAAHNAGRAKLIEIATKLATADEESEAA
ncbi:hypothetical protein JJC00_18800 [Bradyrhizobium diazoefficiens]|uniref:hypothetical protein n=1 Tax=Bradyrhizobium diazoefficiens TaxID=1355477 RepID=UPI00190C3AE7|nr:hypothetical protein [Bradyrhizobium diazoefficiens]QQO30735.1 hypothetical protein JJC00_18800 [Bradyrhizobium diazoefficiens]